MASTTYTVRSGDTLWKISQTFLGSGARYMEIFNANRGTLSDPNKIFPGQVLTIPIGGTTVQPTPTPLPGKPERPDWIQEPASPFTKIATGVGVIVLAYFLLN